MSYSDQQSPTAFATQPYFTSKLPRAVVFDMDGTLLDTETIGVRAWIQAFAEHGVAIDESIAKLPIGCDALNSVVVLRQAVAGNHDFAEIHRRCREIILSEMKTMDVPVKPGAYRILSELRRCGVPLGLATSSKRTSVISHLSRAGLLGFLDVVVCGDEVINSKPSPEIYLDVLGKLGINASADVWAVEDSSNGIRSAHAAGLSVAFIPDLQNVAPDIQALATEQHPNLNSLADRFGLPKAELTDSV